MENLYFIAIVPPVKILDEVTALKHEVASKFNSKHALNAPAHITLHMPFRWKDKKLPSLFQVMEELNEDFTPFEIILKDFDFFEPRVVFVDVMPNQALNNFQKKVVKKCRRSLNLDHADYKNQPFHPHVTIGFRDLKKPAFYEAKKYFEGQTFHRSFEVDAVHLLRHDGKEWKVIPATERL